MEPAKDTFRRREGFIPNPKLRLRDQLREVVRFKQFSPRTEEAYWGWIRQFIRFHSKRHPREMGRPEVQAFLSHLTTARQVAVSTQNQALNALVFLDREVLHKPFEPLGAVERPVRRPKVPVVLSQAEAVRLLEARAGTAGLFARLLYPENRNGDGQSDAISWAQTGSKNLTRSMRICLDFLNPFALQHLAPA